jgi:pseudaminic acid synthase
MKSVEIAGRPIGPGAPPFVIAELSGNHNGEFARALGLVDAVADAGADAVKLQTYTADTITIDHDGPGFAIADGPWAGRTLHDLYEEAHTPWGWHEALFERARARGLIALSSPFDASAIDLLEQLDVPAFKIASFEIVDLPLIRRAARSGRPMIISTGMASLDETGEAIATARDAGAAGVILLHCISGYPTPVEQANLRMIGRLANRFECPVGLSDHTLGTDVAVAAVALGACLIEKHVTLARSDGGPDAGFSLEPDELARLVEGVRTAHAALGSADYGFADSEQANVTFRRSLYAVRDIAAGEPLTEANVRSIRPGHGLPPKRLPDILGRRAACAIARGTPLSENLISANPVDESAEGA